MEAIKDNGDITVEFYYEDNSNSSRGIMISQPILYSEQLTFTPQHTYYCGDSVSSISGSVKCGTNSCVNTLGFANSATTLTSNADAASISYTTATSTAKSLGKVRSTKTVETGRVEHGSYSSQNFKNVYYEFESWPFATKNFKLFPVSRKQYSDSDLRKVYCTNCGKKLSPKFKFCPVCGTKVNC